MSELKIFRDLEDIPEDLGPGIYSFYLDLGIFKKYADLARNKGVDKVNLFSPFNKSLRLHTLTNQDNIEINLYGKSKCNLLSVSSSHIIDIDNDEYSMDLNEYESFSEVIYLCMLMNSPLYIGITERPFHERIGEHTKRYNELEDEDNDIDEGKKYSPEGELYERMYRRNVSFSDLVFACVQVSEEKERKTLELVEKFLQSISNPPLSISH